MQKEKLVNWKNVLLVVIGGIAGYIGGIVSACFVYR